jgi:AdoMet-dependent heme synthase
VTAVPRTAAPALRLVAWELTRSCMLSCRHCRASAQAGPVSNELSTEECERILMSIVSFAKPVVILTGGEPMLRTDVYRIARLGSGLGCRMVMAPCGLLLTEEACNRILESGIQRISLSIDGATPETHDAFRGLTGAFEGLMRGIAAAAAAGLPFQVNTTITATNLAELPRILDLSIKAGAVSFHPFLLVPTGRGKSMDNESLTAAQYEETLAWIAEQARTAPISIKPTCAPHYNRIVRERGFAPSHRHNGGGRDLSAITRGCLGGQGFAFISHIGKVRMCGFLDLEAGDLRANGYDMRAVWERSDLFRKLRNRQSYRGKCGFCEFHAVCGGCRARAFSATGDFLGDEPYCIYQPATQTEQTSDAAVQKQ